MCLPLGTIEGKLKTWKESVCAPFCIKMHTSCTRFLRTVDSFKCKSLMCCRKDKNKRSCAHTKPFAMSKSMLYPSKIHALSHNFKSPPWKEYARDIIPYSELSNPRSLCQRVNVIKIAKNHEIEVYLVPELRRLDDIAWGAAFESRMLGSGAGAGAETDYTIQKANKVNANKHELSTAMTIAETNMQDRYLLCKGPVEAEEHEKENE